MKFSGNNYRSLPGTSGMSFCFRNTFLDSLSGSAAFGFSGANGQVWSMTFKSGIIYDSNSKFVHTYNPYEAINISGELTPNFYRYWINNSLIGQNIRASDSNKRWFVNTSGVNLYTEPQISITGSSLSLIFPSTSYSHLPVTGYLHNSSDCQYRVFGSQYSFLANRNPTFSSGISGVIQPNSSLQFSLPKTDSDLGESTINFVTVLETDLGDIESSSQINMMDAITGDSSSISFKSQTNLIQNYFDGSGLPNKFIYNPSISGENSQTLIYSKNNSFGNPLAKTFSLQIAPYGSTGNTTGSFVTGHTTNNSGFYSKAASVEFLEYSHVVGASVGNNLFSLSCGESIPALFLNASGYGAGASGNALLKKIRVSLYGSTSFYTITGFEIAAHGSGYNYNPYISLLQNEDCIDVPSVSGNQYIYSGFTGYGVLEKDAGYFWGELMPSTSVRYVSGGRVTGLAYTGLFITNDGSGYDRINNVPRYSIRRSVDDSYAAISIESGFDSSGILLMNTMGEAYSFDNWSIKTGILGSGLYPISLTNYGGEVGYSGLVSLSAEQQGIEIQSFLNQTNFPSPSLRISVRTEEGLVSSVYITGKNEYYIETGAHKVQSPSVLTGNFFTF